MFAFETPLRRKARKLASPNAKDFDPQAWLELVKDDTATPDDIRLAGTAFWLCGQVRRLRYYIETYPPPALSAKLSTLLAVASLNYESHTVAERFDQANLAARGEGSLSVDHLAGIGIGREDRYFEVDAASLTDAATDTAETWLYEAADLPELSMTLQDLDAIALGLFKRYSLRHSHYQLWQQAIWEGWQLHDVRALDKRFGPSDRPLATLFDACNVRRKSNFMEYAWIDIGRWPRMTKPQRRAFALPWTVTGIEKRPKGKRRIIVGRPSVSAKTVPAYVIGRAGLEGSYLAPLFDRPLPKHPDLTCELLLQAWHVLLALAEALADHRPRPTFKTLANVRSWGLVVTRGELVDALQRSLEIAPAIADEIVTFFSWVKGTYKGIWGAPLVPLPSTAEFALAQGVLATGNPVRGAEIWLHKGGLDDNLAEGKRGLAYEAVLRDEIAEALDHNEIVADRTMVLQAIKKSASVPEEIDLLVQFSSLMIVGEIKCLFFPADSRERFNFVETLRKAAQQARRKATLLDKRRDLAAQLLGISNEKAADLKVVPLVVMNQGFGVSLDFEGCTVTDAKFLSLYLGSGNYLSEGAINRVDGRQAFSRAHLYRTAEEAADRFEATMRKPPPLDRFVQRLQWSTFAFPTYDGNDLMIECSQLADVAGDTRSRYEVLDTMVRDDSPFIGNLAP